jgi:hypothetical protein
MNDLKMEIEDMATRAEQIASLGGVFQDAFSCSHGAAKDYTGAVTLLMEVLWEYKNDMQKLANAAYDEKVVAMNE